MTPKYLMEMPRKVLFGKARGIEEWCKAHGKERPTLLDLANAREARRNESSRNRK